MVAEPEKVKTQSQPHCQTFYKEQRELDALPDEIAALETEQAEITQLSDPEILKITKKSRCIAKQG